MSLFPPKMMSFVGSIVPPMRPTRNVGPSTLNGRQSQPPSGIGSGVFSSTRHVMSTHGRWSGNEKRISYALASPFVSSGVITTSTPSGERFMRARQPDGVIAAYGACATSGIPGLLSPSFFSRSL